jgi:hypothetical protein
VRPLPGVAVLALALLPTVASAQDMPAPPTRPTGTGVIAGRVLAGDTGRPLPNAFVRLIGRDRSPSWAEVADQQGRFEFTQLPSGSYLLIAGHPRYLTTTFGGGTLGSSVGNLVTLHDGERVEKADVSLLKQGAIEGRVLDEFGDPAPDILVRAFTRSFVNGAYRLMPVGGPQADPTDDKGQFRFFGLAPGTYFLSAVSGAFAFDVTRDVSPGGFAPTYYPGTADVQRAGGLIVAPGVERTGVVLSLVPARSGRVSGRVVGIEGAAFRASPVRLTAQAGETLGPSSATTLLKSDGSFSFGSIPAGTYQLMVSVTSGEGENQLASAGWTTLTTTGLDADNIALRLRPAVTLTGHVETEGGGAGPDVRDLMLVPHLMGPLAGGATFIRPEGRATIRPDASFEIKEAMGPIVLRLVARPGTPWRLSRVMLDGTDVTDTRTDAEAFVGRRLEVVLSDRSAALRGDVVSGRGVAVKDYQVLVFSDDAAKWEQPSRFLAIARPDQNGAFEVKGLPPEHYLVVALNRVEGSDWQDPEVLELLRQDATRVLLSEGEPANVELRLHEWPRRR